MAADDDDIRDPEDVSLDDDPVIDDLEEDAEPDVDELDGDDLEEDAIEDIDDDDDTAVATDDEDDDDDAGAAARRRRKADDDEDDDEDLVNPDDVEADLDTILKDRMVAADDEDDEDEDETPEDRASPATDSSPSAPTRRCARAASSWCVPAPPAARSVTTTAPCSGDPLMRFDADRAPHLLDVALFAPLGLVATAATAGTEIPAAVERTRRQVRERIVIARFIGELVVRQAGVEVERRIATRRAAPPAPAPVLVATLTEVEPDGPAPRVEALPIEGYDSLPASHVLALLDGLPASELDAVAAYERSHRRRRTVLARIDQLRP
jgi:hypothetical protein